MGRTRNPDPAEEKQTPSAGAQRQRREWVVDEIVVAAFAIFGVAGAVFLPLRFTIPPITTSFLLATGLAALTYRYLGGIKGASFKVGTLKLTGSLAALIGIAMLVNHTLVFEAPRFQVWQVSGQVMDDSGNPIEPVAQKDVALTPPVFQPFPQGKFTIDINSQPGFNGNSVLPVLSVTHDGFDPLQVDPNDPKYKRQGQTIQLNQIVLHRPAAPYQPPNQPLQAVPYAAEAAGQPTEHQP
jgi:hypothetical protein